jgi:hypothetical protein
MSIGNFRINAHILYPFNEFLMAGVRLVVPVSKIGPDFGIHFLGFTDNGSQPGFHVPSLLGNINGHISSFSQGP